MQDIMKERIKLSTREILLCLLDRVVWGFDVFDSYGYYRDHIHDYRKWRNLDKIDFSRSLYRLRKQGYIEKYQSQKKNLLKLTKLGTKKALKYLTSDYKIKRPKKWDKKWRIVIFDIPEEDKHLRDIVRGKLKNLGFCQLQKSVWVFPFECKEVIDSLKYIYTIAPHVQYIIAENIESELNLVDYFYDKEILDKKIRKK